MNNIVISKTTLLALLAVAGASSAMAQEVGRVISSTPAVQQVGVPRQVCTNQQMAVNAPKSGAGALMGAIAGGGMGNAVGQGGGKALATLAGVMGGAILGNNIEGANTQVQTVQQCSTQTFYENRTVGYNVVYEYGGKQYSVQMPNDPGPTLQLQVTPIGGTPPQPGNISQTEPLDQMGAFSQAQTYVQPQIQTIVQPTYAAPVVSGYPYPITYAQPYYAPYYAPIGISLGFGYRGGYRGYGHYRH